MMRESKTGRRRAAKTAAAGLVLTAVVSMGFPWSDLGDIMPGFGESPSSVSAADAGDKVTLRIANWEEYIDEGDWDEEEAIELDDREGTTILGENSMVEDFEKWYLETYGVEVEVEYSTFDTNEDLYNSLLSGTTLIWSVQPSICL